MDDLNDPTSVRMIGPFPGTNFAPSFLPDDSGLIFSSNMNSTDGSSFQLYIVRLDGTGLTQVTTEGQFNAFPMFNPVTQKLAWCSSRYTTNMGDINVWLADWRGPGRRKSE